MKTEEKTITPAFANDVLENHNPRNRHLSERKASVFARDMSAGRWITTHQGIAFDVNGDLIDGQKRLRGVIIANTPVRMLVSTGLPVDVKIGELCVRVMDVVDRGETRTVAQQLGITHGISNATYVSAACLAIYHLVRPGKGNYTTTDILFCEDALHDDIQAVIQKTQNKRWRSGFILGPLALYRHAHKNKADAFLSELLLLESEIASPVRAFMRWFERSHSSSNKMATMRVLAGCLKYYHGGKEMDRAFDTEPSRAWLLNLVPAIVKDLRDFTTPLVDVTRNGK